MLLIIIVYSKLKWCCTKVITSALSVHHCTASASLDTEQLPLPMVLQERWLGEHWFGLLRSKLGGRQGFQTAVQ